MTPRQIFSSLLCLSFAILSLGTSAVPGQAGFPPAEPTAWTHDVLPLSAVASFAAPVVDIETVRLEDIEREAQGLPPRYAIVNPVSLSPETDGTWEPVGDRTWLWRLRIESPGAVSLNLGCDRFWLPAGAFLFLYPAQGGDARLFTAADNEAHGQLWTPVVLADDIVVELTVPAKARHAVELELTSVNVGYRGFGELLEGRSGWCNNDVVCPEGDPWRDEIQSVGVISTGGSLFCTGFMVNNTAEDQTPYFMTANHCGINAGNASSLVVYWNFQSPNCGDQGGGSLADNQTGSYWRAAYSASDFTLVELDDGPDPDWNITFAGWDRTSANPSSAVAIHHPNCDEKSISFEYQACTTTSYLGSSSPGDGTHIRVADWDDGTTEPGSSGSPLFDQDHRVVGQLHGGYAACGNNEPDWYGRLSVSWTGGGTNATRLRNWLDPISSGAQTLDLLAPGVEGLNVTPADGLAASGNPGGPFTPASKSYLLENQGNYGINYSVTADQNWVSVSNPTGYLGPLSSAYVIVSINSNANSLGVGLYEATVSFVNLTDHLGDTTRPVTLQVGIPGPVYTFDLNSDPGWTGQGQWAFGSPTGGGGEYGWPDPTSGHTGSNVFGYNLYGDYANNLPEHHLTTTALDCSELSAVSLRFWRWLGVETPLYDHAYVRVSNNGSSWTTIWENGDYVEDASWQFQVFDISAIADGQPTVYIRWTMGTTDASWRYCGWNIDDIQIWGLETPSVDVPYAGSPTQTVLRPNQPNPFNPVTEIRFDLARGGPVRLAVFDLRGRLVKVLQDGFLPAGHHTAAWDGKDETGRAVGSGTYLYRLEGSDLQLERKMVLVR